MVFVVVGRAQSACFVVLKYLIKLCISDQIDENKQVFAVPKQMAPVEMNFHLTKYVKGYIWTSRMQC